MLTFESACGIFHYDSGSGVLTYSEDAGNRRKPGKAVGTKNALGYLVATVNQRVYLLHRIAWLLHYGSWPTENIDHINGDRSDNRISNLRDVSQSMNVQNTHAAKRGSMTGLMGVYRSKRNGKYESQIRTATGKKWLGSFGSPEQAHAAYISAKRIHHAGCTI